LLGPTSRVLEQGDTITLQSGTASLVYLPVTGAPSTPKPFTPSTFVVQAGPLHVRITPSSTTGSTPPTLCG
jgi:hypothetical protein